MSTHVKKLAVIGCNSFGGSSIVARAIEDGFDVIGFNRSKEGSSIFLPYKKIENSFKYKFYQADINKDLDNILNILDSFQPSFIVDLAGQGMVAESWDNPAQWYSTNILAKVKLHDELRKRPWLVKYVRVSTPEVYGSNESLLSESMNYNPSTPYAVSHASIDLSLKTFYERYDFPVIFTRFANFYGPSQQLYRIIPRTIIYALTGKKLQLHGGGKSVRAFIYGDDVADGVMRVLDIGKTGDVYHFSSDRFVTIKELVEIICQRIGVNFDEVVEMASDRPSKDFKYLMDSTKARSTLNWKESVSLEKGIDKTIEWIQDSLEEVQELPLNYIHKP